MTRRSLLQRVLVIGAIGAAWPIGCVSRRTANGPPSPEAATLASQPESGTLSEAEMEDLVAFGEVLVEGRTLAFTERAFLFENIENRTTGSPEYVSFYRTAASTLNRVAGRRFSRLEIRERLEVITRHGLAGWRHQSGEDPGLSSPEIHTLRRRVVPDLVRSYYNSPAGWAVVGYERFPGRCGDLTRYTRPDA